jgi:hypothetical protein
MHGLLTGPQVPSGRHWRCGLPTYVSSQVVTVTVTGDDDDAVMGHAANPSTLPDWVGRQNTSVHARARHRTHAFSLLPRPSTQANTERERETGYMGGHVRVQPPTAFGAHWPDS